MGYIVFSVRTVGQWDVNDWIRRVSWSMRYLMSGLLIDLSWSAEINAMLLKRGQLTGTNEKALVFVQTHTHTRTHTRTHLSIHARSDPECLTSLS